MSNPNQEDDIAHALIKFGAAMARLDTIGTLLQGLNERMSDSLQSKKGLGTELHPDSAVPMLTSTTNLIEGYIKRSSGYVAAVGSILDEFEMEIDEIRTKHQL